MTRTSLLAGASALALSAFAAVPAAAQCIQTGTDVTCAADDPDGFASTDDGLTIDILSGVTVENGAGDAFDLDETDDQTVTNAGSVLSGTDRGIDVDDGDDLTVDNFGEIISLDDAIRGGDDVSVFNDAGGLIESVDERGVRADDDLTVVNEGLIDALNDAIEGADGLTVVNGVGGEIFSFEQEGIDAGDGADLSVTNEGLIDAGDEGIQAGLRARVVNTVDGAIFAFDDAIQIQGDADIENAGFIVSFEEDGIDVDSGTIVNAATGAIVSAGSGAGGIDVDAIPAEDIPDLATLDLLIDNEGVIAGETGILVDPANTGAQTVRNAGEIVGFGGNAADLGAGDDIVELIAAGLFGGSVLFGAGDDVLDLSQAGPGIAGGVNAFFDGGGEDNADLIAFGAGVSLADVLVFDDRDPMRTRLGFAGSSGNVTVSFTDFELFAFGDGVVTAADISAVAPVPLPAGFGLLLAAAGTLGLVSRRRRA